MKRIKFLSVATVLVAGSFALSSKVEANHDVMNDTRLENVEALADPTEGEGGASEYWDCYSATLEGAGSVWVCGNPCVYKEHHVGSGSTRRCYKK